MAILLINKAKVAAILQVSIGYDEAEFNNFIREAQEFDLKPLMCEEFYYKMIADRATEPYKTLIEGGAYTYSVIGYELRGIEAVLAYFAYARYFLNSPNVATSHGVVVKSTPNSTPVPLEDRRNVYYEKRKEAGMLWQDVVRFIDRKREGDSTLFPSWPCETSCSGSNLKRSFATRVLDN